VKAMRMHLVRCNGRQVTIYIWAKFLANFVFEFGPNFWLILSLNLGQTFGYFVLEFGPNFWLILSLNMGLILGYFCPLILDNFLADFVLEFGTNFHPKT
jgi:hypothetical protein